MVLKEHLILVLAGLALGIPAAFGATHLAAGIISDLLYGLKATDIGSIAIAAVALVLVASLAGFLPARRASRVDPLTAIRCE